MLQIGSYSPEIMVNMKHWDPKHQLVPNNVLHTMVEKRNEGCQVR